MRQGPDPEGAAGDQPADDGEEGEGAAEAGAGAEEGARGGGRARAGRWLEVPADFRQNSQSVCESSLTALFVNQYSEISK